MNEQITKFQSIGNGIHGKGTEPEEMLEDESIKTKPEMP